jgi:hypothetical protein
MLHFIGLLSKPGSVKCSGTQLERRPQMLKKLAVLAAALAVSAPALADRGPSNGRGHAYGHAPRTVVVYKQPQYVVHRPAPRVVHHYQYRPAPRPVYVVEQHNHVNPIAFLAGAVIGAAIVHHAVTGY